jgi:predicted short-subunit dehydrogenase-like oxidoreductase (DUF2520 family)
VNIVIIGAGNLACQLSHSLKEAGNTIIQVFSRTEKNAKELADKLGADYTNELINIRKGADLYIIAVSDNVLVRLSANKFLKSIIGDSTVVHTAGGVELSVLKTLSSHYGVLYPFQTFSKKRRLSFKTIPIFIESSDENTGEILMSLAKNLSEKVEFIDFEQRKFVHLAGVFACNFANHMYVMAEKILHSKNISFSVLLPLILETAEKVKINSPKTVQTGPVVRNDQITINKHIELLSQAQDLKNMYLFVSESIKKHQE